MKNTILILLLLVLLSPVAAAAQGNPASSSAKSPSVPENATRSFVPLTQLPGIKEFPESKSIPDLLNVIYRLAIGVAAVLAVFQIMRAGIMYMGGDSVTEKKDAKSLLAVSIGGLILVLSPVIVFSLINPRILDLTIGEITLSPLGSSGQKVTSSSYELVKLDSAKKCLVTSRSQEYSSGESCQAALVKENRLAGNVVSQDCSGTKNPSADLNWQSIHDPATGKLYPACK